MTGTETAGAKERSPILSATNVDARTTSRVVTPKMLSKLEYPGVSGTEDETREPGCKPHIPSRIENSVLLEDFHYNGYRRVDWVGDDKYERIGYTLCDTSCEITNNPGVDLSHE